MAKKRSIWKYAILGVLIVLGLVLSFARFPVAGTNYVYNGFINSIPLGLDLSGGVSAVYQAKLAPTSNVKDLNSAVETTVSQVESLLYDSGALNSYVTNQGGDKIRVEVASDSVSTQLFDLIGQPAYVYIASNDTLNVDDISSYEGDLISSANIKNAYISYDQENQSYGVMLDFDKAGADKLQQMSKVASEKSENNYLYVYIGNDDAIQLSCTEPITNGQTFISGGSITNSTTAQEYAIKILCGTYDASLSLVQTSVISATAGTNTLMYILIALGVALAIILAFFIARYGIFGILTDVSLVVFTILFLFFLQAIPLIQLTVASLAGVMIFYAIVVACHIAVLEKIRNEYATGKKIPLSFKTAFKKCLWPILDSHIVLAIVAIILCIVGYASLRSLGLIILIGAALSLFCSLVVLRFLIKWYLPFNSVNPKPLRLKRSKILAEYATEVEVVEGQEDETPEKQIIVTDKEAK